MFKVTRMEPADYQSVVELANTMNWHMTTADFAFNATLEPNGCFALREGEELVGVATCINYGDVGWFGNLVVKEAYRQKGAGSALVNFAVNYLKGAGVKTVGLYAYPHLKAFYGKMGFQADGDFVVLKAASVSAGSMEVAEEKCVREMGTQDVSRVSAFDAGCFGGCRKKLLELILQNPNNPGYVAFDRGEVEGYVTAKVFGDSAEVGSFVCQRSHPAVAAGLLGAVLRGLEGKEAFMYLPASELELLRVARGAGFREEFGLVRMFLGSIALQDCLYTAESLERG